MKFADILALVGNSVELAKVVVKALIGEGCSIEGCPSDVRDAVLPQLSSGSTAMRNARAEARARIFGPEP